MHTALIININCIHIGLCLYFSENPCPLTFENVPTATENHTVTLKCSTPNSCPSEPQIAGWRTQPPLRLSSNLQQSDDKLKIATYSFAPEWQDDGITFSCQTQDNKDTYLIQNVSVAIECKFTNGFCYFRQTQNTGSQCM